MSVRRTRKDTSSEVINILKDKLGFDFKSLVSVCTDGAMNMTRINNGATE